MNFQFQNKSAFTLLEVLIAMMLLVFISYGIYQATTHTTQLRQVLTEDGDFYNAISAAMGMVDKDITNIYSPKMMLSTPLKQLDPADTAQLNSAFRGEESRMSKFWEPISHKTGLRTSRFVGTETGISFISATHMRIYRNSTESIFAKISYELKDGIPDPETKEVFGKSLYKTFTPNAFQLEEDPDDFLQHLPILEGVTKWKLTYYRKDKEQWLNSWDSDSSELKDKFPDVIQIEVELKGPSQLNFEGVFKFRPEIPINGLQPST